MKSGVVDPVDGISSPPTRLAWGVLAARLVASVLIALMAVAVTVPVVLHHGWNMHEAAIICPDPEVVFPGAEIISVEKSASWGNGSWCSYHSPQDRDHYSSLVAAGVGPVNVFEPRFSFGATALVVVATWSLAVVLLVLTWRTGRFIRYPRPAPTVPPAD